MNTLFKMYQEVLIRFPIGVQAIQAGLLMGSGDLIAQILIDGKPVKKVDWVRTGQFTSIGIFCVGPPLRLWYGVLEKYFGNKGKTAALKKVAADQLLFAPGFLAFIMSVVSVAQGNRNEEVLNKLKRDYPDILINNYKLWPAVQLMNFYMVPLQYQVVTVQFVALLWNSYLSWKMNQNTTGKSASELLKRNELLP